MSTFVTYVRPHFPTSMMFVLVLETSRECTQFSHIGNLLKCFMVIAWFVFYYIMQVNFDDKGRITNLRFVKAVEGVKMKLNCPLVVSGAEDCIGVKRGKEMPQLYCLHF